MENDAADTASDIFLDRLRAVVRASADGKLKIMAAMGCLEVVKQELYEQFTGENEN